jgi:Zn-dependent protease with chaperone function
MLAKPHHAWVLPVLVCFLTACATSPEGRSKLTAPGGLQGLSAVYSEFDMHLQLVTTLNAPACAESECVADRAFEQRILLLGKRLADVAYRQHPQLRLRFPRFEFIIADKLDAGAASSAGGTVVIYRGVRQLQFDDAALGFVLAREMGHIISEHHDENVTTNILVAIAAQILLPVLNVARGAVAAVSSSAGAATAIASTAASFAGARVLRASSRPTQVREAESLAMKLVMADGWSSVEISNQLSRLRAALPGDPEWITELRVSAAYISALVQGPQLSEEVRAAAAASPTVPAHQPRAVSAPF